MLLRLGWSGGAGERRSGGAAGRGEGSKNKSIMNHESWVTGAHFAMNFAVRVYLLSVCVYFAAGEVPQDFNLDLGEGESEDGGHEHFDDDCMIFARGRMRNDVSRLRLRSMGLERRHDLIHLGFCNYLEYIGKPAVAHGQKMLLVEGRSESEGASSYQIRRWVIHLSGAFYNPKAFETIRTTFVNTDLESGDICDLELPLTVKIRERSSTVNAAFQQLDAQSGDKFIFEIEQTCDSLLLYSVDEYRIPFDAGYDHPNLCTEIQSVKAIGFLCKRGQTDALLAAELTARRRQERERRRRDNIARSDPMQLVAQLAALLCGGLGAGLALPLHCGSRLFVLLIMWSAHHMSHVTVTVTVPTLL